MVKQPDPIENLTRTLAETNLEVQSAEHDYRALLQDGSDHMKSRFPASELANRPDDLDHWGFHMEAMNSAIEKGGVSDVPPLPFQPHQPAEPS
jgi:hypothetical protein